MWQVKCVLYYSVQGTKAGKNLVSESSDEDRPVSQKPPHKKAPTRSKNENNEDQRRSSGGGRQDSDQDEDEAQVDVTFVLFLCSASVNWVQLLFIISVPLSTF